MKFHLIACMCMCSVGDVLAQRVEMAAAGRAQAAASTAAPAGTQLDIRRVRSAAAVSLLLTGPAYHYWYALLDRRVPGCGARAVALKTALDLAVASPVVLSAFLGAYAWLDGRAGGPVAAVREQLPGALLLNTGFWLPADALNFRLVAPQHRVGFSNLIAVVWNAALSWHANAPAPPSTPAPAPPSMPVPAPPSTPAPSN